MCKKNIFFSAATANDIFWSVSVDELNENEKISVLDEKENG